MIRKSLHFLRREAVSASRLRGETAGIESLFATANEIGGNPPPIPFGEIKTAFKKFFDDIVEVDTENDDIRVLRGVDPPSELVALAILTPVSPAKPDQIAEALLATFIVFEPKLHEEEIEKIDGELQFVYAFQDDDGDLGLVARIPYEFVFDNGKFNQDHLSLAVEFYRHEMRLAYLLALEWLQGRDRSEREGLQAALSGRADLKALTKPARRRADAPLLSSFGDQIIECAPCNGRGRTLFRRCGTCNGRGYRRERVR